MFGICAVVGLFSGCETLKKQHRKSPEEITSEAYAAQDVKAAKKETENSNFRPGAMSSEARDIEKSMMRTSVDPNWQP
jgi:hypothetical protein